MVAEKKLGDKTGAGFYKKEGKVIHALDLKTWQYRPKASPRSDVVRAAKNFKRAADRLRAMVMGGTDPVSSLARELVMGSAAYALNRVGEIAGDIAAQKMTPFTCPQSVKASVVWIWKFDSVVWRSAWKTARS